MIINRLYVVVVHSVDMCDVSYHRNTLTICRETRCVAHIRMF